MDVNILAGLGASAVTSVVTSLVLMLVVKPWIERRIASHFERIQQAHGIIGVAEIRYREQQLSEFYCPLYVYAKGMKQIYDPWMAQKLTHINEPIKALFREQNECMLNIIRTKAHLIDGGAFPDEMAKFITTVAIWNLGSSSN